MTMISVPREADLAYLGELPDGVQVVVWDGSGAPPPRFDEIEVFVSLATDDPPAPAVLEQMTALRVVQLLNVGVDRWLPTLPKGVLICNARGVHGASTAELAVAGMLASLRDLPAFAAAQRARRWSPQNTRGLDGGRVLMVGAGDIGSRIAAAARVFDAEVTVVARMQRPGVRPLSELAKLVGDADVLALAVPGSPQTRHLVDAALLAGLPDGALVVNVARGSVVDTDALVAELSTGRLSAFLDVVDPEPLPADHPLWTAPNVILTPHVAGSTVGWERRAYRIVAEQIRRHVAGQPLINQIERQP